MPFKIIGAGYGRTGTSSVQLALSELGHTCYHMSDLLFRADRKSDVDFWRDVANAEDISTLDWDTQFKGYDATIDFPSSCFWRELADAFPEAKIILTLHPKGAEGWYDSTVSTIYGETGLSGSTEFGRKINALMDDVVWNGMLKGTMDDRSAAVAQYAAHIEEVQDTIPAERLLVFSADQGWGPFAQFLGVEGKTGAFPRANDREVMTRMVDRLKRMKAFAAAREQS